MSLIDYLDRAVNHYFACLPRRSPDPELIRQQRIIAHRGAHSKIEGLTENTDAAFARAQALGCWGIELDIQETADKVLVVNHDSTLSRIWGVNHNIADLCYDQLHELAPLVPRLTDVIATYGKKMHLFIEPKSPFKAHDTLAEALQDLNPCEDYHLLCLEEPLLASLTSNFHRQSLVFVAGLANTAHFCKLSLDKEYGGVTGHFVLLTNAWTNALQQAGQCTGVGFVDSRQSLYREINRGIPWIFSNNVASLNPDKPFLPASHID